MLLAVSKSEDNSSRLLAPIGEMTGHKQHSQSIKLEGKGVSAAALDSASAGEAGSQIQSPLDKFAKQRLASPAKTPANLEGLENTPLPIATR